jgi:hypothetical protein
MTEEDVNFCLSVYKDKGLTKAETLDALICQCMDCELSLDDFKILAKHVNAVVSGDVMESIRQRAHEIFPNYLVYLKFKLSKLRVSSYLSCQDEGRVVSTALEFGFITKQEFDSVLADCGLCLINSMFFKANDPLIERTRKEVEAWKARGFDAKALVAQFANDLTHERITFAKFVLITDGLGYPLKPSFVQDSSYDGKKFKFEDIIPDAFIVAP